MTELDAILKEFLVESREHLEQIESDLVTLEKHPTDRETLARVFRAIHSIKGATGFLGLAPLGALAHAGETLLSDLRDAKFVINPTIASTLLALVDCVRRMLLEIERTGSEGDVDGSRLIARLMTLHEHRGVAPIAGAETEPVAVATPEPTDPDPPASPRPADPAAPAPVEDRLPEHSANVRVHVEQLDQLMDLAGELVLIRNEMLQRCSTEEHADLLACAQRLNALTSQLQEGIMRTRMQPIDTVWSKFPRLVRDSALECGKTVRLEMEGKQTELDKTLIEAIRDPLAHVLRNCIDHGLEAPSQRMEAGKAPEGRVVLRAFHEGGQVNIEVSDDGAGVNLFAVKQKAMERGLITAEEARDMSDQDAVEFIFLPGFSTAKTITSISGRGVGMDVVRTNVAKIGGKVTLSSEPGVGTTIKIRIPLTLAIMPALIVIAGDERYAIPEAGVVELIRLEGDAVRDGIHLFQDAPVYRRRGTLLPLVGLGAELGLENQPALAATIPWQQAVNIVVLQADSHNFGLVVDEISDIQEIVVKPLRHQLNESSLFAGATIMGDGRAILILDVQGFATHARVVSATSDGGVASAVVPASSSAGAAQALLLFTGEDDARMAVPLSQVLRLEEFARSSIERAEDRDVVQYMGQIMTLVKISDLLPERRRARRTVEASSAPDDVVHAIVFAHGGRRVGIVVNGILDTVIHCLADRGPEGRRGTVASLVIDGRVTEIVDLEQLCGDLATISLAMPELNAGTA
jgi:two-component system chemotaxis sensor kinase CheA